MHALALLIATQAAHVAPPALDPPRTLRRIVAAAKEDPTAFASFRACAIKQFAPRRPSDGGALAALTDLAWDANAQRIVARGALAAHSRDPDVDARADIAASFAHAVILCTHMQGLVAVHTAPPEDVARVFVIDLARAEKQPHLVITGAAFSDAITYRRRAAGGRSPSVAPQGGG